MEEYPKPVTKRCTQNILNQMNSTFYDINQNIGFFCNIKYQNKKIQVLMINNYLNDEEIEFLNNILINNETIELENIIYKSIEYNITIIKIKNNNNLNYIEIDDKLYENESEMNYNKDSIYILQYNNMNDILVSYGLMKEINKNKIIYTGNINSKYSLIFNLSNNKLIGIYNNQSKYYNNGIFLKYIIKEYENKYNYFRNKDNEILLKLKIDKNDINKEIYFLDNYNNNNNNNNNLKELNNSNIELYINNIKQKEFKKYFTPIKEGEYNIKLKFKINMKDCSYMFAGCNKKININFNSFNTKDIINMKYMFYNCENLKRINLYSFNTKNVINMEYMFYNCKSLNNLDLSNFNIKNVTNISYMFYNCESLKNLELFSFNDVKINNIEYMFYNCKSLINLDLSSLNIKNINNMNYMLYSCQNYKNLDLSYYEYNNIKIHNIFGSNMKILYNIDKNKNVTFI